MYSRKDREAGKDTAMSRKIYLVKKEPLGPQTENNWKQLTGREFHEFITSPEGKGRYFIKMEDDFNEGSDIIFIEASKEQYFEWRKEHDQHKYLNYHAKDSLKEIQSILGISRGTVYILLERNLFHYVRIGNRIRVSRKSFDKWLDGQTKEE